VAEAVVVPLLGLEQVVLAAAVVEEMDKES
jgi:hypothetical protein